jgi:hypothetical protein
MIAGRRRAIFHGILRLPWFRYHDNLLNYMDFNMV